MDIANVTAEQSSSDDGVLISRSSARQIVVEDRQLCCVDLIDNLQLEVIDLRACMTPLHLTVRGCPKVQNVLLPEAGTPAVVHWDFGAGAAPVHICGLLGKFDSCQDDGRTTRILSGAVPFPTALLVPEGWDAPPSYEVALLVCLAPHWPKGEDVFGPASPIRAAVVNGAELPEDLAVAAMSLQSLTIVGAARLTSISLAAPLEMLEIVGCPQIAQISASGERLRVAGGQANEIRVQGAWASGQFTDTASRLGVSLIDHLMATGCRHIQPDHLLLGNATNPIGVLPHPDCLGDPKWRALLIGFVERTSNCTSILPAMKLLALLMRTGLAADEAWAARNRLYANLGRPRRADDEFPWLWQSPRDLAAEVYEADLELWIACRETSDAARGFALAQQNLRRTFQMAAVLRVARQVAGVVLGELIAMVAASVEGIVIGRTWINGNEESAVQMSQSIARMVEALVLLREHEAAQTALGHLPELIVRLMRPASQLAPLSALASLGMSQAQVALMARSRTLARSNSALAAQFHSAALQPAKTQLLAHIRTKEIALAV